MLLLLLYSSADSAVVLQRQVLNPWFMVIAGQLRSRACYWGRDIIRGIHDTPTLSAVPKTKALLVQLYNSEMIQRFLLHPCQKCLSNKAQHVKEHQGKWQTVSPTLLSETWSVKSDAGTTAELHHGFSYQTILWACWRRCWLLSGECSCLFS